MDLGNFRSIGMLTAEILAGLAVSTNGGGSNVIDLAERRAMVEIRKGIHASPTLTETVPAQAKCIEARSAKIVAFSS